MNRGAAKWLNPRLALGLGVLGAVLVLAITGVLLQPRLDRQQPEPPPPTAPEAPAPFQATPRDLAERLTTVPLDWVTTTPESIWIASDTTIWRLAPGTFHLTARIHVSSDGRDARVVGLTAGAGAVWASVIGAGIWRIDPDSAELVTTIPVMTRASVAVGRDAVWAVCCGYGSTHDGQLQRIDPASNRVVATIPLPDAPTAVDAGSSGVWARGADGSVWRVDPATNHVVATIDTQDGPPRSFRGSVVAVASNAVWVHDGVTTTVVQLDPARNRVVERLRVDGHGLVAANGGAWTTSDLRLLRLRPQGVGGVQILGHSPGASASLATGLGAVWMASPAGLFRIDQSRLRTELS